MTDAHTKECFNEASHNGKFKPPTLSALTQCGESGGLNSRRAHMDRTKPEHNNISARASKRGHAEVRGIERVLDGLVKGYWWGIGGYWRVLVYI